MTPEEGRTTYKDFQSTRWDPPLCGFRYDARTDREHRALSETDNFFSNRAAHQTMPSSRTVRGDDDQVCVFRLCHCDDFSRDGTVSNARTQVDFHRCEPAGESVQLTFSIRVEILFVLGNLENVIGIRRERRENGDHVQEHELGTELLGHFRCSLNAFLGGSTEIRRTKNSFGEQHKASS